MAATYRTGQAAKLLGVSSHHIRRLCEAGMVEAELNSGNQWRIHLTEIDRLTKEGVPPIPQIESEPAEPAKETATPAAPRRVESITVKPESEAVQNERDRLQVAQSRLQRRKLELEQTQVEDVFEERNNRRRAEAEAERRRARHQVWLSKWTEFGRGLIPSNCPPHLIIAASDAVRNVLSKLTNSEADLSVKEQITASVQHATRPLLLAEAVENALGALDRGARSDPAWHSRAKEAAGNALRMLPLETPNAQIARVARQAVSEVSSAFEAVKREQVARAGIVNSMAMWKLFEATEDERSSATDAVRERLSQLPPGATQAELEAAKGKALASFEDRIQRRLQEREEVQRRRQAEQFASFALSGFAIKLLWPREYLFSPELAGEIRTQLHPKLIDGFYDGKIGHDEANEMIKSLITEMLDDGDDEEDDDEEEEEEENEPW